MRMVAIVASRLRVVLADNDPDVLELLHSDLSAEGHDVVADVAGGVEAVERCHSLHPDVLVLDYRMPPGPNGLDVAEELHRRIPDLRVIMYTNYRGEHIRRRARDLGVPVLVKGNLRALRRAVSVPPAPTRSPARRAPS